MDIVQSNFEEAITLLEATLPITEFVSIDCEMTGIKGKPENWLDSPQLRYNKLKFVATRYSLIQVGIALFYRDGADRKVLPLNFYVFPREPSEKVILEVGAVAFNRKNDMDFNKWIYEGVHYVDAYTEKQIKNRIFDVDNSPRVELKRPAEIEMFREIATNVRDWYISGKKKLEIPALNAFHRKYFYQFILKEFPNVTTEALGDGKVHKLILKKKSSAKREEQKRDRRSHKFQEQLGFRRVFKMLVAAKKPLLGQNLLIDLLFVYQSFEGRLPYHLGDFVAKVHADFPVIYDTRQMYLSIPGLKEQFERDTFGGSSLTEIHEYLKQSVQIDLALAPGCERYAGTKAHEAGYDAFITGELYLMLRNFAPDTAKYCNLLALYKSMMAINLEGGTVLPADKVLVVRGQDLETVLVGYDVKKIGLDIGFLLLHASQEQPTELFLAHNIEAANLESQLVTEDSPKTDAQPS